MTQPYVKQKLTVHQKMVGDAVRIGQNIPYIHTLVELDATQARKRLRDYRKRTNVPISFSTYIMACVVRAIAADKAIQNTYFPINRSVTYNDIDVFYPTEIGEQAPAVVSRIIRNAASLSLSDIQTEIEKSNDSVDSNKKLFLKLPWFIRRLFYRIWFAIPKIRKSYFGTVYFSSILNFSGDRRAWGIPIPMHGFGVFIGTMCKRIVETREGTESRDMVQITLSVDHRVSNGADMGRFVHQLKHVLEYEDLTA